MTLLYVDTPAQTLEADPCKINSTTSYILSKLKPLPKEVRPVPPFIPPTLEGLPIEHGGIQWAIIRDTTLDLPIDLIDFLREKVSGLRNPSLECSRIYLPEWWREVLLRGFEWLWDLEPGRFRDKDGGIYEDGVKIRWDWELLVRQLAQDDCFEATGKLEKAPDGLRNRRRIWRCLDETKKPTTEKGVLSR